MSRYIDADKIKYITDIHTVIDLKIAFKHEIDAIPTADVQEVKHGHWLKQNNSSYSPFDGTSEYIYICSECGRKEGKNEPYCHCGAKMDESEAEE